MDITVADYARKRASRTDSAQKGPSENTAYIQRYTSKLRFHHSLLVDILEKFFKNHIRMKSQPTPFYDTGMLEKTLLQDNHIRPQIEQSISRNFIKLTANRLATVVGIPEEGNNQKGIVPVGISLLINYI